WTACSGSARSTCHSSARVRARCWPASTSSLPKASSELAVPALPGRDTGLVSLGVGQYPEGRRLRVGDQHAARGEGRVDSPTGLVVRHRDVQVDSVALWPRLVHLLEPHRRQLTCGINDRTRLSL